MASGIYSTGTISVSNNSKTVTGTGTQFVGNIAPGAILLAPNGQAYFVQSVVSNTELTLTRNYTGTSQNGQAYEAASTGGVAAGLAQQIQVLIDDFQGVVDGPGAGLFGNGSEAAPGIGFAGDQDTGLRRIASNILGLVTGGVTRARLSATGLQLDVPLTGTAVQTNDADATPGRVMKVGAFGLGGSANVQNDMNAEMPTGFYRTLTTATGGHKNGVAYDYLHFDSFEDAIMQLAVDREDGDIIMRNARADGVAVPWRVLFHNRNIVGTVSHSGGIPTGAVLERGSNANGDYIRYADGTQICWHKVDAGDQKAFGSGSFADPYRSGYTSWTFPAAFTNGDWVLTANGQTELPTASGLEQAIVGVGAHPLASAPGTRAVNMQTYRLSGNATAGNATLHLHACGRWF